MSNHYGWNHEPTGLLADDDLGVGAASVLHYDWFHVYAVSGIFHTELQFLLRFLIAHGIAAYRLEAFIKAWAWPRDLNPSSTRNMFANYAESNDHFKCDASLPSGASVPHHDHYPSAYLPKGCAGHATSLRRARLAAGEVSARYFRADAVCDFGTPAGFSERIR